MKEKIKELVNSRYIENIFPSKDHLEKILSSGKKLNIYLGIDPTGPSLHLGHSTNIFLLKKFQELGHNVIFLIGDFTAMIGDPTGKSKARKALSRKEVLGNAKTYKKQISKIIRVEKLKIQFNSRWYGKINLAKMIDIMSKITYGRLIKRKMFQERIKENREIYFNELIYPILQGYDSVELRADIEIGGNDQTFNMMVGRDLAKEYLKKEKIVIATKLLENPKTGKKLMSKSEGGFIALNDKAEEMFGKVMAMPDEAIVPLYELCTEISDKKIAEIKKKMGTENPRNIKFDLAKEIVKIYHSKEKAEKSAKEFEKIFKEKKAPESIKEIKAGSKSRNIIDIILIAGFSSSKSEAKRLIEEKAVKLDGKIVSSWDKEINLEKEILLQVGKRRFAKIKK